MVVLYYMYFGNIYMLNPSIVCQNVRSLYIIQLLCCPASPIEAAASWEAMPRWQWCQSVVGEAVWFLTVQSLKYLQQWVVFEAAVVQIAIFIVCTRDSVSDLCCHLTLEAVVGGQVVFRWTSMVFYTFPFFFWIDLFRNLGKSAKCYKMPDGRSCSTWFWYWPRTKEGNSPIW